MGQRIVKEYSLHQKQPKIPAALEKPNYYMPKCEQGNDLESLTDISAD